MASDDRQSAEFGQFIDLADRKVRLCFDQGGNPDGPDLVVINGTGSDMRNRPNAFEWPIAEHFRITTWDHRGLGRSEGTEAGYQPTMHDFAADGIALLDALGIDQFRLFGISFGGMVAQELAWLTGGRVERLVLACTSSGGEGGSSFPLHEVYAEGETLHRRLERWDTRVPTDPKVRAFLELIFSRRDPNAEITAGQMAQVQARSHHDMWDRLPQIGVPTLVAYGEYDGVAPPENSEAIASQLPHGVAQGFQGGHFFNWQDPTAWPAMADWLSIEG